MVDDRWEHGSDYAYPDLAADAPRASWLPAVASYWHSGRHALRALLYAVRPKRVLFPSFYCQDVLDAAEANGIPVRAYADAPEDTEIDVEALALRDGDMLIVTNTYGLRRGSPVASSSLPSNVTVVEDHTHDPLSPWAREESRAAFAFASLRKWLPLPDGAMLWSPAGLPVLDAPPFDAGGHGDAASITLDRLSGMLLKQRYLAGEPVTKAAFRARAVAGERAIGRGEPAPMSPVSRALLDTFPTLAWRDKRTRNHDAFVDALGSAPPGMRIMTARIGEGGAPFAIVVAFDDPGLREAVRERLTARNIYPAVLWPLDAARAPGIPTSHVELSARVLCLHCDHRYDARDMHRVASAVRDALEHA